MKAVTVTAPGGLDRLKVCNGAYYRSLRDRERARSASACTRAPSTSTTMPSRAASCPPPPPGRILYMADGRGWWNVGPGHKITRWRPRGVLFLPAVAQRCCAARGLSQDLERRLDGYARGCRRLRTWFYQAAEGLPHAQGPPARDGRTTGGEDAGFSRWPQGRRFGARARYGWSLFALQIAKVMGATVIATSSSDKSSTSNPRRVPTTVASIRPRWGYDGQQPDQWPGRGSCR